MSSLIPDDPTTQNEVETRGAEDDPDLTIKFKLDDSIQSESSTSDSTKLTIPVESEAGEEIKITKVNGSDCNKEQNVQEAKESIWVSNLNRDVKAVDVRELFGKITKVQGVKILTNNSNYFAYVTLKDAEKVAKCIEKLNNTVLNGEKILLSSTKPCIQQAETHAKKKEDNKDLVKQDIKVAAETSNKGNNGKHTSEIIKTDKNSDPSDNSVIAEQKREIKKLKQELKIADNKNSSLKSDLRAERRKYDTIYSKYQNLRRDMEKMENENRQKRRKLILDQENFEHSIKMKMVDVEKLKLDLNRQLEETKQLKERLSKEVNKLSDMKNVNTYKRTRSPSRRDSTSHRGQPQGKKFRYFHDFDKSKTPPPPNLRNESGKQSGYSAASSSNEAPDFSRGMKPPGTGFNRHEKSTPFQQSIHPGPRANTSNLDQRRPKTSNLDQRRANPSNVDQRRVNNYDYGAYSASQPYANALPVRGNNNFPYYQY
ncbi:SAFB-like transcription modulator [Diabrotica virgifera virgifera]|nr:SAFB-like transcription modulator [Diabrotica virgifera virgifera]